MANVTRRERFVIVFLTAAVVVAGGIVGFLDGGVGEAMFISILCGTGAFLGAYLPTRSMAKSRQR